MEKDSIKEHNIWSFCRFKTVQFDQPWCRRLWRERSFFGTTGRHKIGLAAFAQYENSNSAYFDWVFGGLFGRGYKVTFDKKGIVTDENNIWIS